LRNDLLEFAISNKRVASDQRQVQGAVAVDELENAAYERAASIIAQVSQRSAAAEMRRVISITAGTAERAFPRDLDRKRGFLSLQYLFPC
jgi:hypothetical protein